MQPNNPYDFITNPAKSHRKSFLPGGDRKQKIMFGVIAGGLILTVLLLVFSVFLGGSNSADSLKNLASDQQELIRVSDIALDKTTTQSTKNLATTTKLGVQSAQVRTLARLEKLGKPLSSKALLLSTNVKNTKALEESSSDNTFDKTYTDIITNLVNDYLVNLKSAYNQSSSSEDKQLLQTLFAEANNLNR